MNKENIIEYMREGSEVFFSINPNQLIKIGRIIGKQALKGNRILIMGNGGSSIDAQHWATEFVGQLETKNSTPLAALALSSNMAIITSVSNDFGYDVTFEKQVEAYARKGDIVIGMSTSGNAPNVLKAIERAKRIGCITIGLTGRTGGALAKKADHAIRIRSDRTPIIQEAHMVIGHILSMVVEDMKLKKEGKR